ncbi:hypothetical protein J4218_06225 [Candidatus Pacearchaeota archaeon]|nr:hypothetical protein [Candidatus Pacearchaeota archaeon]
MKRGYVKGQISIFIIVGILIGVIGIFGYGLKVQHDDAISNEFFSQEELKPQIENIQSNVFMCLYEPSKEGLRVIGVQGGYYNKPDKIFDLGNEFIPYYYYEGNFLMPSSEKIADELESLVEDKVDVCLNELKFEGFELEHSLPNAKVSIDSGEVIFKIDSLVGISREGKRIVVDTKDYSVSHASALKDILEVANYIVDSHRIDSKMYCISCLDKLAEEKDVYVQNIPFADNSVLVIIGENRTSDSPYLFSFLNKYTGEEISDDNVLTGEYAEGFPGSLEVV